MKRKNILITLTITLIVSLVFGFTGIKDVFEKLDFRLYDGLLHLKKDPPVNEKIVACIIDEPDIDQLGDWPWTRDILADTLIRLKEFNAQTAIFDIEYISPSLKSVKSNAEVDISNQIYERELLAQDLIKSIPTSLARGYSAKELSSFADNLIQKYLYPSFTSLYEYVENNVSSNNDEYFARAAQFFGNTYLTVNNQKLGYNSLITNEDIDYIRDRFLTYNYIDPKKYTKKDNDYTFDEIYNGEEKGFIPALHTMVTRAQGLGYTNSNVDSDGVRRRMELAYEYDDKYLMQLVFGPLLDIVQSNILERTKNTLTIKDALLPGEEKRRDINIPLDNHGRLLINWQHEKETVEDNFYGFNFEHIYSINLLDEIEKNIYTNLFIPSEQLILFDKDGSALNINIEASKLIEEYESILEYKNALLAKCNGYNLDEGYITYIKQEEYDEYFELRRNYFEKLRVYANNDYKREIQDNLQYNPQYNKEFEETLDDLFHTLRADIHGYYENYDILKEKLNNAYCIIGMTAASTTDIGAIPFKNQYPNVGIHANIMNTILTESFITQKSWAIGFLFSLLGSLLGLLFLGLSNSKQNIINGGIKLIIIISFMVAFVGFDIYIPMMSGVIFYNIFDYLVEVLRRYLASSQEKKFITQIASSFANKDTVNELRKNPDAFKTEGQKKCITALFSDIQKFSTLSESISKIYGEEGPNKLIEILNEYLGSMSNEILANNGNIDKYEGDAIISMFGAPDPMGTHTKEEWAYLCLDSAIRMKIQEEKFNNTHQDLFKDYIVKDENGKDQVITIKPLQTRIGVNSGEAYVGLMGSKTDTFSKLNYTMIGDTVNLASRLEGVNKVYNSWILCSDDTWNLANQGQNKDKIIARKFDKVRVVGRSTPVQLYNILGFADQLSENTKKSLEIFNTAMNLYLNKDFSNAEKKFIEASKIDTTDKTCLVFAERCKIYAKKGVPENWDGVMNMTSK